MQDPEPAVDFDTVANEKQQHEVNVGTVLNLLYHQVIFNLLYYHCQRGLLTEIVLQPFRIHSGLVDTTQWWPSLHSSLDQPEFNGKFCRSTVLLDDEIGPIC